nr:MAG TPA: hypothetical protein [Caudoviricetes sp.]
MHRCVWRAQIAPSPDLSTYTAYVKVLLSIGFN